MLTLYRPGTGPLHRMPAGTKALVLAVAVLGLSFLPSTWWAAGTAWVAALAGYLVAGLGARVFAQQLWGLRWLVVVTAGFQLVFLSPEAAVTLRRRLRAFAGRDAVLAPGDARGLRARHGRADRR